MADVDTVLICLPFAGAGPSFFTPWQKLAPEGLRILPVSLPGREKRFPEPAYDAAAPAVDDAYAQVTAALGGADGDGGGNPVVLFGHSMGAVLAYELAHRIERAGGPVRLAALVVSGAPGPWTPRTDRADGLPDEEFAARVRAFAGYDHPALADPEMRELLLPALRADVRLHETYVPSTDSPLSVPVISVRGREDTLVGAVEAAEWGRATTGKLTVAEPAGGHMYLAERPGELLELVAAEVRAARGR
ncbi:thioesterase II family protein [Streptomyces rubiginosohelvolus]|uniref:Oleoyl-ACP hydrolase n=1 Tax=Streptomyces rubiginosohelvolus TaxID=67362 RepID=A0ABQ3BD41_9ACTN|nr:MULTISPECIES: alpha/beta fold hydrolase [Streptomyces]WST55585.1 alpha/beta fold hydrolase [Streptomyces rubiginosohelvolus]GGR72384.1 oleoyl-ACP hydrolase [Streptomyces rubiginosohelvolus]GGZ36314.1 oleoyl-ACP hydrolase [Streptomyces pluricolorescens]